MSQHHRTESQPSFVPNSPFFVAPEEPPVPTGASADNPKFDLFTWHPQYASCQRYFLDHAQHTGHVQAVAAFLNIHLPFQRSPPVMSSQSSGPHHAARHQAYPSASTVPQPVHSSASSSGSGRALGAGGGAPMPSNNRRDKLEAYMTFPFTPGPSVSLIPYLRRLVATGLDFAGVLHGFFGDDWPGGIGPLHEQERRNFLFCAKAGGWARVKREYDMPPLETVPFLRPLQGVLEVEVAAAERSWSEWLALEDWMVGPRAPSAAEGLREGDSGQEGAGMGGVRGHEDEEAMDSDV